MLNMTSHFINKAFVYYIMGLCINEAFDYYIMGLFINEAFVY